MQNTTQYAPCPNCGQSKADNVSFTWWAVPFSRAGDLRFLALSLAIDKHEIPSTADTIKITFKHTRSLHGKA